MNTEETTVRETLHEWANEAVIPHDLGDRALARRRRRRYVGMTASLATTTVALVGVVLLVTQLGYVSPDARSPVMGPGPTVAPTDVRGDPENSPPRTLVAAGNTAMSAYYTEREEKSDSIRRTWHLYDPDAGRYRAVPWAYLDVAPGMRTAAVLEHDLPADRIGLFDMKTWKVTKWIPLEKAAGSVAFSPDGTRLLAITYEGDPDAGDPAADPSAYPEFPRTGFYVIDLSTGELGEFQQFPQCPQKPMTCLHTPRDFGWSRDGSLIYEQTATVPTKKFYDLQGNRKQSPPHEDRYYNDQAGLSPNGRYIATWPKDVERFKGNVRKEDLPKPLRSFPLEQIKHGPLTVVTNVETGEIVGAQPVEELLAWADNDHLIAWDCADGCENQFRNRLVLVSVDGEEQTPLTGFRSTDWKERWRPVFTPRAAR